MMAELRVCFEIKGLAEDENGEPCACGFQMSFGTTEKEIDYETLTKNVNITAVLQYAGLSGIVKPEDVKVITPEEYDRLYGEENEDG